MPLDYKLLENNVMKSILLVILTFSLSCTALPPPPEYVIWQENSKDPSSIIGLWQYSRECGGFNGGCRDALVGHSTIKQITSDSIFTEQVVFNDTTFYKTSYYVDSQLSPLTHKYMVRINTEAYSRFYSISQNYTLWFSMEAYDGISQEFIRVK